VGGVNGAVESLRRGGQTLGVIRYDLVVLTARRDELVADPDG
jgi:hypothetical protein